MSRPVHKRVNRYVVFRNRIPLFTEAALAENFWTRGVGLLGRRELGKQEALILQPCASIHTFTMKMTIDVAFLMANGEIGLCVNSLKPNRIASHKRAVSVLELAEGMIRQHNLRQGDKLEWWIES